MQAACANAALPWRGTCSSFCVPLHAVAALVAAWWKAGSQTRPRSVKVKSRSIKVESKAKSRSIKVGRGRKQGGKHNQDDRFGLRQQQHCSISVAEAALRRRRRRSSIAALQHCSNSNVKALQHCSIATLQHCSIAALQHCSIAAAILKQHESNSPHLRIHCRHRKRSARGRGASPPQSLRCTARRLRSTVCHRPRGLPARSCLRTPRSAIRSAAVTTQFSCRRTPGATTRSAVGRTKFWCLCTPGPATRFADRRSRIDAFRVRTGFRLGCVCTGSRCALNSD
eukprot:364527-Chlamydomonas_euryale.AAC.4